MTLIASPTILPGVLIIEPVVHGDSRGFFMETWREDEYRKLGIQENFVQDNHSRSGKSVLRGLHFQQKKPQGKLVRVSRGSVFDVAVDVNRNSPTFKKWVGVELSDENFRQFYVPPGYAHGFCVLSNVADFIYKCTAYYDRADEVGFRWNDPEIAVEWPIKEPLLSERDKNLPLLRDYLKT
jgi:dTDP-4-dehydrorhamnose 3,5-epimerase